MYIPSNCTSLLYEIKKENNKIKISRGKLIMQMVLSYFISFPVEQRVSEDLF